MAKDSAEYEWLSEVDRIDWSRYPHAYGEGTEIPGLIRETLEPGDRGIEAARHLSENVNHQGSIYPATVPAIPFLIQLLEAEIANADVRSCLSRLLGSITSQATTFAVEELEWLAANPGEQFVDPGDPYAVSFVEALRAVWRGKDCYSNLLQVDPDADVRMNLVYLVGHLVESSQLDSVPHDTSELTTSLIEYAAREDDELAISSALFALGRAPLSDQKVREFLQGYVDGDQFKSPKVVAACLALVENDRDHSEWSAVDVLIKSMMEYEQTDTIFQPKTTVDGNETARYLPWIWGRLRFRICRALSEWSTHDSKRLEHVLPALLVGIKAANGYTAEADLTPIMRCLWPGRRIDFEKNEKGQLERILPPEVQSSDLTEIQRRVIEACCDNSEIWNPPIGNTSLVFMNVGLPEEQSALKKLLR